MKTLYLLTLGLLLVSTAPAREIPRVAPAKTGMSAEQLQKVSRQVDQYVQEQKIAGAIVAVARHGKIVHFSTHGMMDREAKKPMREDTLFRIYSMTKSIATAAALMLYDEGKFDLDDPVAKFIPEFKNLKVQSPDGPIDPKRPMTIRDLMRHTSGLTYGFFGNTDVDKLYRQADVLDPNSDLATMTTKLSRLPLIFEPGSDWAYSVSIDVLGRLVEIWSGKDLDQFLQERIFDPLDMKDTGFHVPADKLDRFAAVYSPDGQGGLELNDRPGTSRFASPRKLFSGGGGLVSTTRDYLRFLLMIQNDGTLHGKRLLKKKTVAAMIQNQVPEEAMPIDIGGERPGVGFGLGFSVRVGKSAWDPRGRIGEYGWGGMASTHYWASPKDDLVVVTMEQTLPYSWLLEFQLKGMIYDAIKKE